MHFLLPHEILENLLLLIMGSTVLFVAEYLPVDLHLIITNVNVPPLDYDLILKFVFDLSELYNSLIILKISFRFILLYIY